MAEKGALSKSYELDSVERQYVHKAVATLRGVLVRGRLKEIAGSDIYELRGKEIEALDRLLTKFS